MIITIDGPAGAGKSSVARDLADRLEFRFLDTGAMYRAVTHAALQQGTDLTDEVAVAELAGNLTISIEQDRVRVDGQDITDHIRSAEITANIRFVADNTQARKHLVDLQRRVAGESNFVTEGRDQGTVAFPDASFKIFLTASPEERARRRLLELQARGDQITLEQVLAQQNRRDEQDERRPVGSLIPAEDAVVVVTDGLSLEQVVDRLEELVRESRDV